MKHKEAMTTNMQLVVASLVLPRVLPSTLHVFITLNAYFITTINEPAPEKLSYRTMVPVSKNNYYSDI